MPKSTQQLISILERVGVFASAQELHRLVIRSGDSIGLTTVYRALQKLHDEKLVDVIRRSDGEALYRLCGENHHHHLVCKKCGTAVEIEAQSVEKWAKSTGQNHGYTEVSHSVELFGYCASCSKS